MIFHRDGWDRWDGDDFKHLFRSRRPRAIATLGTDFSIAINAVPPVPAVPPRNRHSAGSDVIIARPQNLPLHGIDPGALLDVFGWQFFLEMTSVTRF